MTNIDASRKGKVEKFLSELRRENRDFDNELSNAYNYAMRNQRKDWGIAQLKLLRIAYRAGEHKHPIEES